MVKGLKGSGATGAQLESLNLNSCIYIRVGLCLCGTSVFPWVSVCLQGKQT